MEKQLNPSKERGGATTVQQKDKTNLLKEQNKTAEGKHTSALKTNQQNTKKIQSQSHSPK